MPLAGGCSCGGIRYRLTAEPMLVHCCHCRSCQRQTGSAFVVNVVVEADRVEVTAGEPQPVDVPRDDGGVQTISRCPDCRIAVFSRYGGPELRFVRAGTLDEPDAVAPDVHIYVRSKLPWVLLPEGVPAFDAFYDPRSFWSQEVRDRYAAAQGRDR